jgi:alanine-synthesizing transaminase
VAAAAALNGPQECVAEMRATYKTRRDALIDAFSKTGWSLPVPDASMFVWAKLPEGFESMGSLEFSKQLVEQAGVAVAPGVGFGEHGEGYVRIALVENEQRIRQAARAVKKFLNDHRSNAGKAAE